MYAASAASTTISRGCTSGMIQNRAYWKRLWGLMTAPAHTQSTGRELSEGLEVCAASAAACTTHRVNQHGKRYRKAEERAEVRQ